MIRLRKNLPKDPGACPDTSRHVEESKVGGSYLDLSLPLSAISLTSMFRATTVLGMVVVVTCLVCRIINASLLPLFRIPPTQGGDQCLTRNAEEDVEISIGPCHYAYPRRLLPVKGWLKDIDFYFHRSLHKDLEKCFLDCIDALELSEIDNEMLIEAARLGLTSVAEKLYMGHVLDPLYTPPRKASAKDGHQGFNAIQEAIHAGNAEIVKILTRSNNDIVIDEYGRSVIDYVVMKGSPIRPANANNILGIPLDIISPKVTRLVGQKRGYESKSEAGWNRTTSIEYEDVCDIDIVYDDMPREVFFKDYVSTGRPFLLSNHTPNEEMGFFARSHWDLAEKVRVGPTAYPSLTGQKHCQLPMTIVEIEATTKCEEMPDLHMVHARHPDEADFQKLYPMYSGNVLDKSGGWRKLEEWYGPSEDAGLGWQVFFGGDGSGATYHWHNAALNILYVGVKEWRLAPPLYKGYTGMQAQRAMDQLDDALTLHCVQYPGDLIFFPNSWGHLTINHGFTIGAAVILGNDFYQKGYSLREITKDLPFLFIHINKTGGSSLIQMMSEHCESEYVVERWGRHPRHRSFHATAHSYIEHYGRDTFDQAYTFAVVRHPLARQVSNFFFLADRCKNLQQNCRQRHIPESIDGVAIADLSNERKIKAFDDWILALYHAYPPGSPDHYLFGSLGHGNEEYETFGSTQTSWLVDDKELVAVESVFKLEDLSRDLSPLSERIMCLSGASMAVKNQSPKYPDFMLFAENKRTRDIMKEVYAADFKNFGYEL